MIASATSWTASSWPTTRSCRISSSRSSFSRSPSCSRLTGMPVQRDTMAAISSSVTTSRRSLRATLLLGEALLFRLQVSLEIGQLAVPQLGGTVEVVGAFGHLRFVSDLLDLLPQRLHLLSACRSASHWARMASASARRSASSLRSSSSRDLLAGSVSLASAASSISSRVTRRVSSSSSAGIESISVRSIAQASSTRSIALSGRNRSEM